MFSLPFDKLNIINADMLTLIVQPLQGCIRIFTFELQTLESYGFTLNPAYDPYQQ